MLLEQSSSCRLRQISHIKGCINVTDAWRHSYPWSFLNDLLVSSLNATVSLKQIHHVPMLVTKHLNLHMSNATTQILIYHTVEGHRARTVWELSKQTRPGVFNKLLDQHDIVIERLAGFSSGGLQLLMKGLF